jgi:hypothetical protein
MSQQKLLYPYITMQKCEKLNYTIGSSQIEMLLQLLKLTVSNYTTILHN